MNATNDGTAAATSGSVRHAGRWLAARWLEVLTAIVALGITALGFLASFVALRELAAAAGLADKIAWVWPVIVDGIIVLAIMALFAWRERPSKAKWDAWAGLIGFTVISIASNAYHTLLVHDEASTTSLGMHVSVAVGIGAVPPASMAVAIHFLVKMVTPHQRVTPVEVVAAEPAERTEPADALPAVVAHADTAATEPTEAVPAPATAMVPVGNVRHPLPATSAEPAVDDATPLAAAGAPVASMAEPADEVAEVLPPAEPSPIPSNPSEQVMWIADLLRTGRQVTKADLTEAFAEAGLPASDRTVHRRLADARAMAAA